MTFDPKEARALVKRLKAMPPYWVDTAASSPDAVSILTAALDEIERLREYAFEVSKALTGLTVGGSEFFKGGERLGFYEADIPTCVKNINWRIEQREKLAGAKVRSAMKRYEKAEAERDTAWNDAIEAAAGRIDQTTQMIQQEMTLRAQRFAAGRRPDFNDAFHRADLDARISCRDQVRTLRKGEPT
jgi:hypothetical protein